jgi:hypothetical protein
VAEAAEDRAVTGRAVMLFATLAAAMTLLSSIGTKPTAFFIWNACAPGKLARSSRWKTGAGKP